MEFLFFAAVSVLTFAAGLGFGYKDGMVDCKLKPKECEFQFTIYQKQQELKNFKNKN